MRCEDAHALMMDALVDDLETPEREALDEHLRRCAECAAANRRQQELWTSLGQLPLARIEAAGPDAGAILSAYRRSEARRRWLRPALATAAAAALFLAGVVAGRNTVEERSVTAKEPQGWPQTYVLLLHTPVPPRPTERAVGSMEEIIAEYRAWADQLRHEGRLVAAEKLTSDPGEDLWRQGGLLQHEIPPIGDSVLGGLYMVRAHSYEDAVAVASSCPHLQYGGIVRLRQVEPTG